MDLPRSNEQQTQFNDWITQFSIPCQKKKKRNAGLHWLCFTTVTPAKT